MPRTRIKICGITRREDALAAERAGCDAMGFVFWEKSKRHVTLEQARDIRCCLPSDLNMVGVFVDPTPADILEVARKVGLNAAQLHNPSPDGDWKSLASSVQLILAVGVGEAEDITVNHIEGVNDYLFDHRDAQMPGGTGQTFDWSLLRRKSFHGRVWLAGGLNPSNVACAIATVRPYAVDVSTGVETEPGIKSAEKIAAFIKAVRDADAQLSEGATQ